MSERKRRDASGVGRIAFAEDFQKLPLVSSKSLSVRIAQVEVRPAFSVGFSLLSKREPDAGEVHF
jgi:hypothetical protein